ncbi:hypothetical protein [Budvicia aquatica]|uniref:hypothetical protein n=1 Tax=Budvicia aquatica TaxID=82979 RepID=UPI002080BDB7|nr:hypothetical protein [Budvicia aquatica]GKX51240.1 hypothetical protein SOASR029_15490 [Budvicia aquatica]
MNYKHVAPLLWRSLLLVSLSTALPAQANDPLPKLEQTRLFTQIAHNCQDVDMQNWQHPTRKVLTNPSSEILQIKLCNDKSYPVFFLRLKYDPRGQTSNYYKPLYKKMRKANGNHPYTIVSVEDNLIMNISYRSMGMADVDYQRYQP